VLRVVVIEDDPRYRSSLEQLFGQTEGFELAASYASALPAVEEVERGEEGSGARWDIAVTDLEMPGLDGIQATRRLKAALPRLKVVVLTVFEQPETILEAICAGADGYLLKRARARELIDSLREVADGGAPLTSRVAHTVLDLLRRLGPAGPPVGGSAPTRLELTEREQQVLRALVEGLSYKQAADVLGIHLGTVRTHIASVYRKLQVHSVAEAVARALRERLV
jgi:DNA-binding NarL/FixJ family response regulator